MARPRSSKVLEIKAKLVARIRDGFHRPGDPFLSNRALAERYDVSYQTAHTLLEELVREGLLGRRPSSGTFIAGRIERLASVALVFSPRAKVPGSFGASLLQRMRRVLDAKGITHTTSWSDKEPNLRQGSLPIFWEAPELVNAVVEARRFCLLLQAHPPVGLGASFADCVSTDDFSGGACAAQVLIGRLPKAEGLAVISGPADDRRSRRRVEGFLSLAPKASVISGGGWFFEHGVSAAAEVRRRTFKGVFCCNDRIANGLLSELAKHPELPTPLVVGFDNAPIAEAIHLTTIAVPWEQFVEEAVSIVERRLAGDGSPARQVVVSLRPHARLTA